MKLAGLFTHLWEMRKNTKFWEDNIKIHIRVFGYQDVYSIELASYVVQL
jgi:hypothetical protein